MTAEEKEILARMDMQIADSLEQLHALGYDFASANRIRANLQAYTVLSESIKQPVKAKSKIRGGLESNQEAG